MLNIHTLPLGAYQTNCYILHGEGSRTCCVIDPGYEPETVLRKLNELGLTLEAILLTHGHFDHVGAVRPLVGATGCRLYIHQQDFTQIPLLRQLYPLCGSNCSADFYEDGDRLFLAGLHISVLHTPGHTPGSVCLQVEDSLFSGDTLFAGSCGRTDLPGGSSKTLLNSLQRLKALEGDYTVYPGHGGSSSLSRERAYNPYL